MKLSLFGWRPARYVVVGGTCAVVQGILMVVGDAIGIHYAPMSFIAFLLVTPLGYLLHSAFTFGERQSWSAFLRFGLAVAASYPIALASFALLCSVLRLPMLLAVPIATVMVFVWNYVTAHWAILGRFRID